jgi:cytochrome c
MELLKTLALPQSAEHIQILLVVGGMVSAVLFPYLGFLLGTAWLSIIHDRRGRRTGAARDLRFGRDLIALSMGNSLLPIFMAVLPAVALTLVQAEISQDTDSMAVAFSGYGTLALAGAVILLSSYRFSFTIGDLLGGAQSVIAKQHGPDHTGIASYAQENTETRDRRGRWGIVLLVLASLLLVASVGVIANIRLWTDTVGFFGALIVPDILVRLPIFAGISSGATGIGVLFFFFMWEGGIGSDDAEYDDYVRAVCFRLSTYSLAGLPVFLVSAVLMLPPESLSGLFFGLSGAVLVLFLLAAQLLYAYAHEKKRGHLTPAFIAFSAAVILLAVNDHVASGNAVKFQAALLGHQYDKVTEEMESRLGVSAPALTGADIYNSKCSACHLFDVKKVGPPYNTVVRKYFGQKDRLISFVLGPVKVDPGYPSMPAQGLKPSEADSIATYLLARVAASDSTAGAR